MDVFLPSGHGLGALIERHVPRNPGDRSIEELFDRLGAFEAPDARFTRFLEGLVTGDVIPDEPRQRGVVATVNRHLAAAGAELREVGVEDGYPVFAPVSTRSGRGRPKNLIFASSTKPDIRFRDAIDNDIGIVGDAGDVLVYDRPIGADGIRWSDLQAWWAHTHPDSGDEATVKKALYARMRRSIPAAQSPPQLQPDETGVRSRLWVGDEAGTSWASVDYDGRQLDTFHVRRHGPRRVWDDVETAWVWWNDHGRPGFDTFGLDVTSDGVQRVWCAKTPGVAWVVPTR